MSISTIITTVITWLLSLVSLLTGRSSSRIQLDVRSEKSIEAERKRREKLYDEMTEIDNELQQTIRRIVRAKRGGNTVLESRLNDKRDKLFQQFRTAKRQYDDLE